MAYHTATTTREVEFRPNRLPDELKALICERRRLIRVATVSQRPEDKLALNRLHRRIRKELLAHHNRLWETKLSNISDNNGNGRVSFWKFIRKYKNRARLPLPTMRDGNFVAENDADKATLFADHLATQCVPPAYLVADEVLCESNFLADAEEQLEPITIVEIVEIINALPRESTWPRRYHQRDVKAITNGGGRTPMLPHQLYDGSRHLPLRWKTATVVMLPKTPRPASTPSKYRPISLLSAVGKVAEAVILRRLKAFVDASHALPEFQFGFRQGHFTTQQLLPLDRVDDPCLQFKEGNGSRLS
jgi:hypothetical protein